MLRPRRPARRRRSEPAWPSSRRTARRSSRTARSCPRRCSTCPRHGWVNLHFSVLPGVARRGTGAGRDPGRRRHDRRDDVHDRRGARRRAGARRADRADPAPRHRGDLLDRLAVAGAELLVQTLDGIEAGLVVGRPQPADGVSFAPKVRGRGRPGRLARARHARRPTGALGDPEPGAWTTLRGARLGIGPVVPRPDLDPPPPGALAVSPLARDGRDRDPSGGARHRAAGRQARHAGRRLGARGATRRPRCSADDHATVAPAAAPAPPRHPPRPGRRRPGSPGRVRPASRGRHPRRVRESRPPGDPA